MDGDVITAFDEDAMFQDAANALIGAGKPDLGGGAGPEGGAGGGMPAAKPEGGSADPAPGAPAAKPDDNPPASAQPAAAAAPATPAPTPIDFEGISNGLVKSVDDITRISSEHRAMAEELNTLREQVKRDPFANEAAKTFNQMQADGKTQEQIDVFMALTKLGDISKLTPMEAMTKARVLRDGYKEEIVTKMLERKYEITEDMPELERQIAEIKMADDAKTDYEYLVSQKKELATAKPAAPAAAVSTISKEQIQQQVNSVKDKVKEQFTSFKGLNLNGKVDKDGKPTDEAVIWDLPIPQKFVDSIPGRIEKFFVDQNLEVNKENMQTAVGVINYELFNEYGVKLIQDACNEIAAKTEKKVRDEYENKGFKRTTDVHQPVNANHLEDEFLEAYAKGE